jgi:hypothetical protein
MTGTAFIATTVVGVRTMKTSWFLLRLLVIAAGAIAHIAVAQQQVPPPPSAQRGVAGPAVAFLAPSSGQLPAGIFQMEHFSFLPPAEPGWNVGKVSETEKSFFRTDVSKAWINIKDEEYPQCSDVRQALAQYGERFKRNWEGRVNVIAFQSAIDTYDGKECLRSTVIFDATTARVTPPITTGRHMTEHSLVCIFGNDPNRLLTTTYLYHAEDDTDPRKQQAQAFFLGLRFKNTAAK